MILIIGYGNPLRSDDAVGQHVAKELQQRLHHLHLVEVALVARHEPDEGHAAVGLPRARLRQAQTVLRRSEAYADKRLLCPQYLVPSFRQDVHGDAAAHDIHTLILGADITGIPAFT